MKQKFIKGILWLLVAVTVVFLIYKLFFWVDGTIETTQVSKDKAIVRFSETEMQQLQPGDIILRRGYGFISDMVARSFTNNGYEVTHAGILINEKNEWKVYHSLSSDVTDKDGVQKQSLNTFLDHSYPDKLLVVRLKNFTTETEHQLTALVKAYEQAHIPFDKNGNYNDASEMFCTEFIIQVYGKDLKLLELPEKEQDKKDYYYSLSSLYDTLYFDKVINKFAE